MPEQKHVYIGSYSLPVGVAESESGKFLISRKPGGLAIGVEGAFKDNGPYKKAHWMGIREAPISHGKNLNEQLTTEHDASYLFITPEEKSEFYSRSVNGVIWPLTHSMPEKIDHKSSMKIYEDINLQYADKLYEKIMSDIKVNGGKIEDILVWLHDSHIASAPKYLKKKNPNLKISYFHHTTWVEHKPEPDTLKYKSMKLGERTNPIRRGTGSSYSLEGTIKRQDEIRFGKMIENLLFADSIGFHTQTDLDNFLKTIENFKLISGPEEFEKIKKKLFVNPIGIPKEKIEEELSNSLEKLQTPSKEILSKVKLWKEDIIPKAKKNKPVLLKVADRLSKGKGTLHDLQSLELSLAAYGRIIHHEETPFDQEFLKFGQHFDPSKTHIGSVQRFDYTKGVHEQLLAFQEILQEKKDNGIEFPQKEVQLNLVCSSARDIPAYAEYERVAMAKIAEINKEFPNSVNYIPGIPNTELPIFNASNDLSVASSTKDGYILSIGEAQVARVLAINRELIPLERQTSGTIVSNQAGISESLGGKERQSKNEALAIVDPTVKGIKKGFKDQLKRIERARADEIQGDDTFKEIPQLIPNTREFGTKALNFAFHQIRENDLEALKTPTNKRSPNHHKRKTIDDSKKTVKKMRLK